MRHESDRVGGDVTEGPSQGPRSRVAILGGAAAIAVALILAGSWLTFLPQSSPPQANSAPHILRILARPTTGDTNTQFVFTAQVVDVEDPVRAIQVRWAWENGSVPDTSWSTNKSGTHVFPSVGNYTVRCEASDTGGLTTNALLDIRVTPRPLRVGTILSLTGALQAFGPGEQNGVDMAVQEINAAGGVHGRLVQVFHMDDSTDPSYAASDAATLVSQDHVDAIIGATGSGMCAAILPVAKLNGVFELSPSCTRAAFTDLSYTGGWFGRTAPSDELQAVVGAYYAYQNESIRYSAAMGINNVYGVRTAAAYVANFTRFGGTITAGSPRIVNEFGTDYTADLHAILDVTPSPQAVYVAAYPPDGEVLMQNWWAGLGANPGWANVTWMFSEGVYDQSFIDSLVASGVNVSSFHGTAPGAYAGFLPSGYGPWAARYQARYGGIPPLFAANAYDAAYLVALAAEAAADISGTSIRANVQAVASPPGTALGPGQWAQALSELAAGHDVNYEGASGSVNLNALGDVPGGYIIWAVNRSNGLYAQAYFNETTVVSMLPSGFFPTAPPTSYVLLSAVSRGENDE